MRRKLFAVTIIICLFAAMGLTGCGKSNPYAELNFEDYVKLSGKHEKMM